MAETLVFDPTTITIGDANIAAQSVTSFKILVGTTTGGPYTTSTGTLPNSALTDSATGATGPFSAVTFSPALSPNVTYFMVCEAVNASGASGNSPEVEVEVLSAPSTPTSFSAT
jgi:hypothetical protein